MLLEEGVESHFFKAGRSGVSGNVSEVLFSLLYSDSI
jgi:hypothetical protein